MTSEKHFFWLGDDCFSVHVIPTGENPAPVSVAGISFRMKQTQRFMRRTWGSAKLLGWLWPEPENPHDQNAVRVMALEPWSKEICQVGYLPRDVSRRWSSVVERFHQEKDAFPAFYAEFRGGTRPDSHLGMVLAVNVEEFLGEGSWFVGPDDDPEFTSPRSGSRESRHLDD